MASSDIIEYNQNIVDRVFDPVKAATGAMDYNDAVRGLASSTLGGILGTYQLGSLLAERAEIAEKVLNIFKVDCDPWGVHVERVEVKSLVVAREMIVPMAREAKAAREANGLVILQRGEKKCLQKIRFIINCFYQFSVNNKHKQKQTEANCLISFQSSCR